MDIERRKPVPPPPPHKVPARVMIPQTRPNFDGFDPDAVIIDGKNSHHAALMNSMALLEILNKSKEAPTPEPKKIEKTDLVTNKSQRLKYPWLFWGLSLLFIAVGIGLFVWIPQIQHRSSNINVKRGLETIPDPSSPTTDDSGLGDPYPSLNQPTRPSRD